MTHRRLLRRFGSFLMVLALLGGQVGAASAARVSPAALPARPVDAGAAALVPTDPLLDLGLDDLASATAGAPEAVDIAGPGTTELGEATWYAATVSPDTATLPITLTWVTDGEPAFRERVITRFDPLSLSITFTEPGTNFITVTATNDLGTTSYARKVWVTSLQPDLAVTDISYTHYRDYDILGYQMANLGDATVTQDFTNRIWVNETYFDDVITRDIAPGERLNRTLSTVLYPSVACAGTSTTYRVEIDVHNDIDESDERYNERREIIPCDPFPPRITNGPTVSAITETGATVRWATDEDATSLVLYGTRKGAFNLSAPSRPTLPTQAHQVVLSGLLPGTTYEYKVRSADAAGNVVESRPATFETAPPTLPAPPAPELRLVRDPDNPGAYWKRNSPTPATWRGWSSCSTTYPSGPTTVGESPRRWLLPGARAAWTSRRPIWCSPNTRQPCCPPRSDTRATRS
jgi:hypothetical protein